MRVIIAGQKMFGEATLALCLRRGHTVVAVCAPPQDRLRTAAERDCVPWLPSGHLRAESLPEGTDLIIAAHSHDFIGRRTRLKARLGAIGYHPSLLPLHRGRDAVEWTIRMRDRIAGGTVYWLSDSIDAGDIAAQAHVMVETGDTAQTLWRRELFPLGLMLIDQVLADVESGCLVRIPQNHALATWEPSIGRPPVFRPELPLLGSITGFEVVRSARGSRAARTSPPPL
jgi:methionyl-tRNA formyltransferase